MENSIIVFDTETTGLPDWKSPSEAEHQPHLVQLAAHQVNTVTRQITQSMDVIIKPDGWEIPAETTEVHGITTEYAHDVGVPEKLALEMFLALWGGRTQVCHNTTFDRRIIRIGTKRYFAEDVQDAWHGCDYECTMIQSRKIIGGKNPTLGEAYQFFTGQEMEGAHTAIGDVNACLAVYRALQLFDDQAYAAPNPATA